MRDVTKVISDAEYVKLRALLAQTPDLPVDDNFGKEYPKMLYHPNFVELYRLVKSHPDPLVKKEAQQKMNTVVIIVHTIEDEEDYLSDGWVNDPNEIMTRSKEDGGMGEADSRIPTGREGRRSSAMNKANRESELREIRRRYAELTGRKLAEDDLPAEPVAAAPAVMGQTFEPPIVAAVKPKPQAKRTVAPPPAATNKRDRVKAAAQRAASPGHQAHA